MNYSRIKPYAILLISALFLLNSCAAKEAAGPPEEIQPVQSLLIMPAGMITEGSKDRTAAEEQALRDGQAALDRLLAEFFKTSDAVTHGSERQEDQATDKRERSRAQAALALGRSLAKEAVLLATIQEYKERQGTEYSIISPASVAFDYKLLRTENGEVLCAGAFQETQKPVLDNVFEFFQRAKRGLKWVTADTLLKEGLEQKLEKCQYLKELP